MVQCVATDSNTPSVPVSVAPPPNDIVVRQNGRQRARVSWQPVDRVLLYRVTIRNQDQPNSEPMVANATAPYLDFDTLSCTTYDISVSSFHRFLLPGEPNDVSFTSDGESGPGPISITVRLESRSAFHSEALHSHMQNIISGREEVGDLGSFMTFLLLSRQQTVWGNIEGMDGAFLVGFYFRLR